MYKTSANDKIKTIVFQTHTEAFTINTTIIYMPSLQKTLGFIAVKAYKYFQIKIA